MKNLQKNKKNWYFISNPYLKFNYPKYFFLKPKFNKSKIFKKNDIKTHNIKNKIKTK